jgi:sialate O-acetylesterase
MKQFLIVLTFSFLCIPASPQTNSAWYGKKCAVVLTYDDAIDQHLDNAIPVLDSAGLKATFYITGFSASMQARLNDWKKIAGRDHELGNHTLYHPCTGSLPDRQWVNAETDMDKYTVKRMENEIRMTNLFLQALDGKTKRTFAYTCGDRLIGDSSFLSGMKNDFIAARGVSRQMNKISGIGLTNVNCYPVSGESGAQMIEWVQKAMETNSLLVFLFHGVGGGHSLNVSNEAHRELILFLKQHEKEIMIAPMYEVAVHIKDWQNREATRKRGR